MIKSLQVVGVFIVSILMNLPVSADAGITAEDIFKLATPELKAELLAGEVVSLVRKEQETDDAGLAVSLAVVVPTSLETTLTALKTLSVNDDPAQRRRLREIVGTIPADGSSKVFAEVGFDKDEKAEVKKLLQAEEGDDYNFSRKELSWLRQASTGDDQAQAATNVLRRVLASRYLAYRKAGVEALPPYARGRKNLTYPGKQLAATTEAMPVLRQRLPDFYKAYRNYPRSGAVNYKHRFFWEKKRVDDQPMFSLRHEMVQIDSGGAVLANREYYINTQLNTYQVVIVLVPYGTQTIAALANQTFTDKVKGRKRFIAAGIGRSIVESNTKPLFEKLRAKLGRAKPVAQKATIQ
jgi:hypothetical protein